jgi:pyridoxamine 5'-phosphate oxidase family protein
MFTEKERAYLQAQPLARLATVSASGQPDATVVFFELEGDEIVIGSAHDISSTRKYKNVSAGGDMVSLVIDYLAAVDPMTPVAVKVDGTAEIEHRNGRFGPGQYLVIRPRTSWSWGVEGPPFVDGQFRPHKSNWRR